MTSNTKAPTEKRARNVLLLADQVVASGTNALAIVVAALLLDAPGLNSYALIQLVGTTLIALQRALVIEPSLSVSNAAQRGDAALRWFLWFWVPVAILCGTTAAILGGTVVGTLLAASIVIPGIQDLMRYRALGLGFVGRTLAADCVWLVFMASGALFVRPSEPLSVLAIWTLSAGISVPFLFLKADEREVLNLRQILAVGRFQVAEWSLATITSTVPLFLVGLIIPLSSAGAFRLAQTLTGPLNTISSFVSVRFLLDAGTLQSLSQVESRARIRATNRVLIGISLAYSAAAMIGYFVLADTIDTVTRNQLLYALPITLLSSVATAPVASYVAFIKARAMQRFAIRPRAIVLLANGAATALGLWIWSISGLDPLVIPIAVTAIVVLIVWSGTFRRVSSLPPGRSSWMRQEAPLS